jgi:Holliday junction resolvasome RuvABC endonuclease subunit
MKQIIQNYKTGEIRLEEVSPPICRSGGVLVRNVASAVSLGTARGSIINSVEVQLKDSKEYHRMTSQTNPFGDGKASERIVNILLGRPYEPFNP